MLAATVTALEEHGFSVEVVDDLDAARKAVLARIPHGASVMTNTSVTLAETGIADAINDGGPYESARNKMFALDFATQAQEMKAIGGQPDYALGSVHAITRDGTLVIASASGSQLASYAWGAANVIFVVGAQKLVPTWTAAHERIYQHSLEARRRTRDRRLRAAQLRWARSWRSTRNCPAVSTSSSSARWSGSDEGIKQARGARRGPRRAGHRPAGHQGRIPGGHRHLGRPGRHRADHRADHPGAQPRWASDAVADADIVVLAIPLHRFGDLDPALLDGKLVIDAMNYWPASDGVLEAFETAGAARSWPGG